MENITEFVTKASKSYEVFWGVAQNSVVIFRNDNVVAVLSLEKNTESSAVAVAQAWFSSNS